MGDKFRSTYFKYFLGLCCISTAIIPTAFLLLGARILENQVKSQELSG
jgi:hypothetical protein